MWISDFIFAAEIDLATITDRMEVKKAVQSGNVQEAIEKINDLNPTVDSDSVPINITLLPAYVEPVWKFGIATEMHIWVFCCAVEDLEVACGGWVVYI